MILNQDQNIDKSVLGKTLNKTRSLSLIIGSVLGSGLMILPGLAYRAVGVVSFYSWLVMGLFMIPFLYIFTNLTIRFPSAGGLVNVIHQVLGSKISFSVYYLTLFATAVLVPVVSVIGANYISYLFKLSDQATISIAAIMLIITSLINIFNVNLVLKIQGISATILLILLFFITGVSTKIALPHFLYQISQVNLISGKTIYFIGTGMVLIFWAFLGWENLSFTSEEFVNIKVDLPTAVVLSFLIMMALYLTLSLSVIGILSPDSMNTIRVPLAEVIGKTLGNGYGQFVAVIGILVMIINLNAWVWGPSRLLFDCGRKKIMPKIFFSLGKYKTPSISLLTLLAVYLLILGYMLVNKTFVLDFLIKLVNANFITLYLLVIISFLKLRKSLKDLILGSVAIVVTLVVMSLYGLYILIPLVLLFIGMIKQKLIGKSISKESVNRK